VTGEAGAGKSVLLRWLATAATTPESTAVPLWFSARRTRPERETLDQWPAHALEAVYLPLESPAASELRGRLAAGTALVLVDDVDDAPAGGPPVRERWRETHAQVVIVQEPEESAPPGFRPVPLHDLGYEGPSRLLAAYWPAAPWHAELLARLASLPAGEPWLRNPGLLAVAALTREKSGTLPEDILDLYERAVGWLVGQGRRGDERDNADEGQNPERWAANQLFGDPLGGPRFSPHRALLTYLAACRLRTPQAATVGSDGAARDAQDMALALGGAAALKLAWNEARSGDIAYITHFVRALRYAGTAGRVFAEGMGAELGESLVQALCAPSGWYGAAHRDLADSAFRTFFETRLRNPAAADRLGAEADRGIASAELVDDLRLLSLVLREPALRGFEHVGFAPNAHAARWGALLAEVPLADALETCAGEANSQAAELLAGQPEALALTATLLAHPSPAVRAKVLGALALSAGSNPPVREAARAADAVERWQGQEAIRATVGQELVEELQRALYGEWRDVRPRAPHDRSAGQDFAALPALELFRRARPSAPAPLQCRLSLPDGWDRWTEIRDPGRTLVAKWAWPGLGAHSKATFWFAEQVGGSGAYPALFAVAGHTDASEILLGIARGDGADRVAGFVATYALAFVPGAIAPLRTLAVDSPTDGVRAAALRGLAWEVDAPALALEACKGTADGFAQTRATALELGLVPDGVALAELLEDPSSKVRAAAIRARGRVGGALADLLPRLRTSLAKRENAASIGEHELVIVALLEVLGADPRWWGELHALLQLPDTGPASARVVAAAIRVLGKDPKARGTLRERLQSSVLEIRSAAAETLAQAPIDDAPLLTSHPATNLARGALGIGGGEVLSAEAALVAARLRAWVARPHPLGAANAGLFAAARGWILGRLGLAEPDRQGRLPPLLLGEVQERPGNVTILRVRMGPDELVRSRNLGALHNLIEAWSRARHLRDPGTATYWLACASVPFEDLIPPDIEPGTLLVRGIWYGLRLRPPQSADGAEDNLPPAIKLLASTDRRAAWDGLSGANRTAALTVLSELALRDDLDGWAVVPLLAGLWEVLPPDLASLLAARLPDGVGGAGALLDAAARAPGARALPTPNNIAVPVGAHASRAEALEALARSVSTPSDVRAALERLRPLLASADDEDVAHALTAARRIWDAGDSVELARVLSFFLDGLASGRALPLRRRIESLSVALRHYLNDHGGP
jgi:hypothetical protein